MPQNEITAFYERQKAQSKELQRLYYADSNFEYVNLYSLKALLILNRKLRVIPFHVFGINCEL